MNTSTQAKARQGLLIFFVVLIAGSAYFEYRIVKLGSELGHHAGLIFGLMWWVTVASVVARLVLRESPRDVSFRWGGSAGTRAALVATTLPVVVGLLAYGVAWSMGLARFATPELPKWFFGGMALSPAMKFFARLLLMLTYGGLLGCLSGAGEEIGWRGYMVPRLMQAGVKAPILISGLVWSCWHTPLILSGLYAAGPRPLRSACIFVIGITAAGFIFAWLRLSSGSIWPCVWAHGVWNAVIQGAFDRSTNGFSPWVGESGVLTAALLILFAVVVYRRWPLREAVV